MAPMYKIAVIQFHSEPLDIVRNYERSVQFITKASAQGAQLAVLPEYHLSGWYPRDPRFRELAREWKDYLLRYQALAKDLDICLVPGTIVQLMPGQDGKEEEMWNVAYFIDNKGDILGSYQKKNLWHTERQYLTSSNHTPHDVIDTPFGLVGLLICWDLGFPEAFRQLISQGAKLIIMPTCWTLEDCSPAGLDRNPRAEALFLDSSLISRAFENTCAVIFANAGGPGPDSTSTDKLGYAGLSQVAVPFVGALGRLSTGEEGMSVVDLDMTILDEAEDYYKVRTDIARQDWYYEYRHKNIPGDEKISRD